MSKLRYDSPERLKWHEWTPGLDNGHWTLGAVLETMKSAGGAGAMAIPWIIRLLENPTSPLHLPGAISLERHDAVHILLGRGMRVQDEAFVIGFTMGADPALRDWHVSLFKWASNVLYPKVYRFTNDHLVAFELGVREGRRQPCTNLHLFPFEDHLGETLDSLRKRLGINRARLYAVFRHERILLPATKASWRLDYCRTTDPSAIRSPAGPPSGWIRERHKPRHGTSGEGDA